MSSLTPIFLTKWWTLFSPNQQCLKLADKTAMNHESYSHILAYQAKDTEVLDKKGGGGPGGGSPGGGPPRGGKGAI